MQISADERFIILETKLAYQERLLEELNHVLIGKGKELDDLRRRLAALEALARQGSNETKPPHERPPHY